VTKMLATRDGFGQGLAELGGMNRNVVALCADVDESTRANVFRDKFPDRFFEVGVAEQNMVGMAAGMALAGKIPFAVSYASFVPCRTYDQIRISVAYNNANVKLVGGHAGLTTGFDGATHQTLEDIAMMRALPNMTVIVPADAREARLATMALGEHRGPAYLRLGRAPVASAGDESTPFKIGQAQILRRGSARMGDAQEGNDATIVACGIMVNEALEAADQLAAKHIGVTVINCHTIKPLDTKTLLSSISQSKIVVTAEEAQVNGGLGDAIASLLAENMPHPMAKIAVRDRFGQSGKPQELLEEYGLTARHIAEAVIMLLDKY